MTPYRARLCTFLIAAVARQERRKRFAVRRILVARILFGTPVPLTSGQQLNLKGAKVLWYRKALRRRIRGTAFGLFALIALGGSLPTYLSDNRNTWAQGWLVAAAFLALAALHQLYRSLPISIDDTPDEVLMRIRDGSYVVKEWGQGPQTRSRDVLGLRPPTQIVWHVVSESDAYLWLLGRSKRKARKLFPEPPPFAPLPRPMGYRFRGEG